MSFLVDSPWLYGIGKAYAERTEEPENEEKALKLGAATIAAFWGLSVPLYLNQRWTTPVWKACLARSGRDWMVNSGVLRIDPEEIGPRGHAVAAGLFATYPLWLWLGYRHGRRSRASGRADT
ncbi:MAG: hypothetical protein M9938_03690 [Solirubrobacterales bacterium]|nr:hypothetical protein [Solirubrobacterales bacterium]